MVKNLDKHFDNLFLLARDVKPVASARLAAAILYKNEIMSFGFNSNKTHPFQKNIQRMNVPSFCTLKTMPSLILLKIMTKSC